MELKKRMGIYFLYDFPAAGNKKQKYIYNEKKICCVEPFFGTVPELIFGHCL